MSEWVDGILTSNPSALGYSITFRDQLIYKIQVGRVHAESSNLAFHIRSKSY